MIVAFLGVITYGFKFRLPFAIVVGFFMLVLTPLSGISAETGISIALRDLSNVLIGILLYSLFVLDQGAQRESLEASE